LQQYEGTPAQFLDKNPTPVDWNPLLCYHKIMKIIHCADIHIGSALQNLPAEKARIRKREILDAFFRMLAFAGENGVRAVIIAGDLFDSPRVSRQTKRELFGQISSLCQTDFLYLPGNHDKGVDFGDIGEALPPNFHILGGGDDWKYFRCGNVCIAGYELSRGGFFWEKLRFERESFNIAVLHGEPAAIPFDRLKGRNINYLSLGDIHIPDMEPKRLDSRGVYAYSGCLEGRGFDETGERGFFLLDIEGGTFKRRFVEIAKRKYHALFVDISGLDDHSKIYGRICEAAAHIPEQDIVKVILKGRRKADAQIERENLEVKLSERFFFAKVEDSTSLDMDSIDFSNEISLRSEFVKLVSSSDLPSERKEKILEYGIKALSGEAIDI
jgi:exonuclease SbcD